MPVPPMNTITPSMLAGITHPTGGKAVSAEANELINRLREHYRAQGKTSAAHNYGRHLKSFFAWAEGNGYSIHNLPVDAVESFLSTLAAAGQKETTLYVMRTQLKSALRECGSAMGLEVGHIEYQTGKPPEVRKAQKDKEKQVRAEKRLVQTAQQLQAIRAAQATIFGAGATPVAVDTANVHGFTDDGMPVMDEAYASPVPTQEDTQMTDQSAPQLNGANQTAGVQNMSNGPAPIVINVPPSAPTRPTTTLGAQQQAAQNNRLSQPARGVVINNFTFNGPFIRVSRMADGSDALTPPGTEVFVQTLPSSMIAPHGDIASFLQSYLIPKLRLSPMVTQVHFIFNELNDKKQPTGRRDEMVVSVPSAEALAQTAPAAPVAAPMQMGNYGQMMAPPQQDSMTNFLIQKLDRDAEEAKKRAEALQEEMKKASDAQTTFMLMQNFQREQELRREIEERRMHAIDRARNEAMMAAAPAPTPVPVMPPMPFPVITPEPQNNGTAEIAKAMNESQTRMMEIMLAAMNRPQPVAPPPPATKDVSEWLIPFIAQMNQQSQQQAQAQQQMMMQQQNQTVQILQAMLTRENPMEKILLAQLQEVKAAANAPKADELESFADKLQKMKMVSDMLGGNSGPGFLSELLANADTIGAGAAKVIAAAKTQAPAGLNGMRPGAPAAAPALPAPQASASGATPPEEALEQLSLITAGVESENPQQIVNGVAEYLKVMFAQPEGTPYPAIARRLLGAFQNAEDEGELYTFAKNLWKQVGAQHEKHVVKNVAGVLAHWYSEIHEQLFGTPRELDTSGGDESEGETVDAEATDVGEETAA